MAEVFEYFLLAGPFFHCEVVEISMATNDTDDGCVLDFTAFGQQFLEVPLVLGLYRSDHRRQAFDLLWG
jgi:hypothetical protein